MNLTSKTIVTPFATAAGAGTSMTMIMRDAAAYNTATRVYSRFPSMVATSAAAMTYQFMPIECGSFNRAIITPLGDANTTALTVAIYVIHSDQHGGGTPTFWKTTLLATAAYTAAASIAAGDYLDVVTGNTLTMLGFAAAPTLTQTGMAGLLFDSIGGCVSLGAGSASHTSQVGIAFLGGATHMGLCFTSTRTSASAAKLGFLVTLSE